MLGWTVDELLARPYLEFVHPEDRVASLEQVEKQLERSEPVLHFENRFQHKDGSWRVLSWRSVPQAGGLMYATARDVTERRQAEEKIRRLNLTLHQRAAQLEVANKELEAFSYSVSHDLRAPLRHIQGYVGMLNRESGAQLSEKGARFLKTIAEAGREMGQLIDDLLAFSRMGRAELRETIVDPRALIEEVRRDLEMATRDRPIEWRIDPLPAVRADPALLKQVWANLISNAVKYTRGRTPAVIEIGRAADDDGRVVLYVRDNGAGFDMEHAGKLFGVFQRLHRPEEFEGTGIGLANVRRIVLRHGGRIWAESRVNAGATFFFSLQPGERDAPTKPSTNEA
jgi:light-regulated signal transduction histidine kinase (bacteriophytochrome)